MKQRLQKFFEGRQGMDELSKALFWGGLAALLLSGLCIKLLNGALSTVLSWLGLAAVIFCFVRAFSRRLRQRKNYKFFKCPGCGTILRVPRGKGKIHISCKCGYILYRKT